jgi:universal stress protein A
MFQRILVPTDFSKKSQHAVDIAIEIALLSQGMVNLLHVIEIVPHTSFDELKDFYAKLEEHAEQEMNKLIAPYQNRPVQIESKIVYGNRVREILNFAETHKIDLMVMNSHRIDLNDPDQGWGTISYKVGALSQCPILLVK